MYQSIFSNHPCITYICWQLFKYIQKINKSKKNKSTLNTVNTELQLNEKKMSGKTASVCNKLFANRLKTIFNIDVEPIGSTSKQVLLENTRSPKTLPFHFRNSRPRPHRNLYVLIEYFWINPQIQIKSFSDQMTIIF